MIKGLSDEGMCNVRHSNLKGNLYFVFEVEFPENGFLDEKNLKVRAVSMQVKISDH